MDTADLKTRFTYYSPTVDMIPLFPVIRNTALSLALLINDSVPEGREKSLAITKLEEVVMWANAGIARHGEQKAVKT